MNGKFTTTGSTVVGGQGVGVSEPKKSRTVRVDQDVADALKATGKTATEAVRDLLGTPKKKRWVGGLEVKPQPRALPLKEAAQAALDAYEARFGSSRPIKDRPVVHVNFTGPIDAEMIELRRSLSRCKR